MSLTRFNESRVYQRVGCLAFGHSPALVTEPCRCLRCGEMIEWDRHGGWKLVASTGERHDG